MNYSCEKHSEAQVHRGRNCVACEIDELQRQITGAQMLSTRMWNWMNNPENTMVRSTELNTKQFRQRFLQEFRQAR
ncbi:hypothetical protein MTR80_06110 [Alcaligenes aquatilis]|uniref:Uncharacterized protein n=1 Tax=Alcaligenes aquatilis TaxID=323284 RepID=A0ABY4NJN9_9BURK|nr:hypothetical protein [Alcaligenes aquatilis]UQN37275.1 hypothetical protein MTR80_06110 [Alcaligenes aquatilis]